MSKSSRDKGKRAEREAAALLSEGLGGRWRRAPLSGALAGNVGAGWRGEDAASRAVRGDIVPPEEYGDLVVEVKYRRSFDLWGFVFGGGSSEIERWWRQATAVADDDDFVVLMIKVARRGWIVVVDSSRFADRNTDGFYCRAGNLVAVGLDVFLEWMRDHRTSPSRRESGEE